MAFLHGFEKFSKSSPTFQQLVLYLEDVSDHPVRSRGLHIAWSQGPTSLSEHAISPLLSRMFDPAMKTQAPRFHSAGDGSHFTGLELSPTNRRPRRPFHQSAAKVDHLPLNRSSGLGRRGLGPRNFGDPPFPPLVIQFSRELFKRVGPLFVAADVRIARL